MQIELIALVYTFIQNAIFIISQNRHTPITMRNGHNDVSNTFNMYDESSNMVSYRSWMKQSIDKNTSVLLVVACIGVKPSDTAFGNAKFIESVDATIWK